MTFTFPMDSMMQSFVDVLYSLLPVAGMMVGAFLAVAIISMLIGALRG